jgi:hypothetical protein
MEAEGPVRHSGGGTITPMLKAALEQPHATGISVSDDKEKELGGELIVIRHSVQNSEE